MKFVSPKKLPAKTSGYLVIQSDDTHDGDWFWHHKIRRMNHKYTQFAGNPLKMSVEVNSKMLNDTGRLTSDQLKKMYDEGTEVINHCQYHISLGLFSIYQAASAGATSIRVYASDMNNTGFVNNQKSEYKYKYLLSDGINSEEVTIASTTNPVQLASALQHSYAADSSFTLTNEAREELVEGCHDDLVALGITPSGFCFPYHGGSYYDYNKDAVDYVATQYDTARGQIGATNNLSTVNWNNLKSFAIRPNGEPGESEIDDVLDSTVSNGYLTIVYGHGETDSVTQHLLDYVIDGAISRGITILSQNEAYLLLHESN